MIEGPDLPDPSELTASQADTVVDRIRRAQGLFNLAQPREALELIATDPAPDTESSLATRLLLIRGLALADAGDLNEAVRTLRTAARTAKRLEPTLRTEVEFALFGRESDFQSPDEALPRLATLRQLVASTGNARALAGLHLSVARLEGLRGRCTDAQRHLELARRLVERAPEVGALCALELVETSLESTAGNLQRAWRLSEDCSRRAEAHGLVRFQLGSAANLSLLAFYAGALDDARARIERVLARSGALSFVRIAALDTLAQIELATGRLERCDELLEECHEVAASDALPARSWNDLASDITRTRLLERLNDWAAVVELVDNSDSELERRQYRGLRTLLLCAKARSLAILGLQREAENTLAQALDVCPSGAIDALICLEATKGACLSVYGTASESAAHFERSLGASRAIGHRHYESWIRTLMGDGVVRFDGASVVTVTGKTQILRDTATLVRSGSSVALLTRQTVVLLTGLGLADRVDVRESEEADIHARPSVSATLAAGTFELILTGSARRFRLSVSPVVDLDELQTLNDVANLVRCAIGRLPEGDPSEQDIWPPSGSSTDAEAVFQSPRMVEVVRVASRLAATNLPILLTGETGTGKEVLARLIHRQSQVGSGPFVPFNCSSIPKDLVESQLFGHRRGAFTGALESFSGIIRAAEGGTLFLDEIGELDLTIQPKLLRFLELNEVQPVGEAQARTVAVRVVAATNADLETMVQAGQFRADLFYRISVAGVVAPPLRERKEEIPALAKLFVDRFSEECGRTGLVLSDELISALLLFDWPGNIRQLANEIRRCVALAEDGESIGTRNLSAGILRAWRDHRDAAQPTQFQTVAVKLDQTLASATAELERKLVEHALEATGGRVSEAAKLLGLSRKGLFLKRRRRGLVAGSGS